jgi:Zn-finger domain-containing protein
LSKAILAALLGCAPLKKNKAIQQVEVAVKREEVVAHETLRLTTLLNDTIYLRNERLVIQYDTIQQKLRIEQVRPVVVVRDSVVRWNAVVQDSPAVPSRT